MVYDFKVNRILFYVGLIGYLVMVPLFLFVLNLEVFQIVLLGFLFVFGLRIIMRRNTSRAYQLMHQKLYVFGQAKEHLETVTEIYQRPKSNKAIYQAVRIQNYAMANIFVGDFDEAKKAQEELNEGYIETISNQPSLRFSLSLIDVLIQLFTNNRTAFDESMEKLKEALNAFPEKHRENIENNPYSVYYMIQLTEKFITQKSLKIEDVEEELEDKGTFLKTCVLYTLYTHNYLSSSETTKIIRESDNSLFFKDESRGY